LAGFFFPFDDVDELLGEEAYDRSPISNRVNAPAPRNLSKRQLRLKPYLKRIAISCRLLHTEP
jgi:hypothetical protein